MASQEDAPKRLRDSDTAKDDVITKRIKELDASIEFYEQVLVQCKKLESLVEKHEKSEYFDCKETPYAWTSQYVELLDHCEELENNIKHQNLPKLVRTPEVERAMFAMRWPDRPNDDSDSDYDDELADVPTIENSDVDCVVRYAVCLEHYIYRITGRMVDRPEDVEEIYNQAYSDEWPAGAKEWMKEFM